MILTNLFDLLESCDYSFKK